MVVSIEMECWYFECSQRMMMMFTIPIQSRGILVNMHKVGGVYLATISEPSIPFQNCVINTFYRRRNIRI